MLLLANNLVEVVGPPKSVYGVLGKGDCTVHWHHAYACRKRMQSTTMLNSAGELGAWMSSSKTAPKMHLCTGILLLKYSIFTGI